MQQRMSVHWQLQHHVQEFSTSRVTKNIYGCNNTRHLQEGNWTRIPATTVERESHWMYVHPSPRDDWADDEEDDEEDEA
jgi:hypothetical protein